MLQPNHQHSRLSHDYHEESTILNTSSSQYQQSQRSNSTPTKVYGGGTPIPYSDENTTLQVTLPPHHQRGIRSSSSSLGGNSAQLRAQTKSPPSATSSNSSNNYGSYSPKTSPLPKEEVSTSEWTVLQTQNHDQLFPLEGHATIYWEQSLEDEDDLTQPNQMTLNRTLNMIVLYGGTGPIRGNTNQVYCMVPKHSGNITSSSSTPHLSSSSSLSSAQQQFKFQWVSPPTHYISAYNPTPVVGEKNIIQKKSSKTNVLSGASSSNDRSGSASPRRSSFESLYIDDGSAEIPLFKSRYDHSFVLCGNNKAYMFGGRNGMFSKTPLQDFILYSLDMNIENQFTWEIAHVPPKSDRELSFLKQSQKDVNDLYNRESPLPRFGHACCAVNQKQSVLQPIRSTSSISNSAANLDTGSESDSLSDLSAGGVMNNNNGGYGESTTNSSGASSSSARFNSDGGVVLDCAMLLFGGVAIVDYRSKKCKETSDFWMFNCKERKWLHYPSIIQRYFKNSSSILQSKTLDDSQYMQEISLSSSGGNQEKKRASQTLTANRMSIHSAYVPEARYGHQMCVVSNSLVFVIGGATYAKDKMYKDIWMLSLNTFEWRKVNLSHHKSNEKYIQKIPIRYASHVVIGRRVLMYGGQLSYDTGNYLKELLCFDTETYTLSVIENSVSPRFDTGLVKQTMVLYGMDILIIGGKRGVSSYRYNDSVQQFSLKLLSVPKTNQKFLRENTKMKKSNQILNPNEIDYQIQIFESAEDEEDEFSAANSVKIQLIAQILMSEMSTSDYSRKEALKYLSEFRQIDIVKQLFRDPSIHKALATIMQSGSKSDIRQTAKVLLRYFKDTDQGTLPFIIARQVLKFVESYLTLINSLIRLGEPIRQTLHIDYLNLFHLMCQNFEYYESLSKEIISVFHQCFRMHNPLCKASLDVLQLAISSFSFLSLNAMHFASKCDKDLCATLRQFITQSEDAKAKALQQKDNKELQGSVMKLDELLMRLKEALAKLSSRSKTIKKHLGRTLKGHNDDDDLDV
ncbi:hypothetical protein C9374_011245 [Naegleria lovaniensis]|uniref:Uncharacterized protein n=1 Tax=Naegleria lovaniensis TaxID=51637 RepID=A0AA88H0C5_NAELO|nr:uncharacterized protein C9374_011245 [Naegleria lovaniensis]KAG2392520.1 hypothetical protein C9374_011245 [Naegleria lovaniensis]